MAVKIIEKYIVTLTCTAPLHIGSGNKENGEVLVHPISGKPFAQASSIAGVLRSVSEKINSDAETKALFGYLQDADEGSSSLRIGDGSFAGGSAGMAVRPRVAIDPDTGSVSFSSSAGGHSVGHKFETVSIAEGSSFSFELCLLDASLRNALQRIFSVLKGGEVQFGGQKSSGSGFVEMTSCKGHSYDLSDQKERRLWAAEDDSVLRETISSIAVPSSNKAAKYTVTVIGKTEGELLVKGTKPQLIGEKNVTTHIQNAKGEFIIPGSSLKGAFRNRMTYIAEKLGKRALIEDVFGTVSSGGSADESHAGCFTALDSSIGSVIQNNNAPVHTRIHIDKFTGGVINGGLFSERNAYGNLKLNFRISDRGCADEAMGLLLFAIRDLAAGLFNLGGEYNIGKGFIAVETVEIKTNDGSKATLDFKKNSSDDKTDIIGKCLAALQKAEVK